MPCTSGLIVGGTTQMLLLLFTVIINGSYEGNYNKCNGYYAAANVKDSSGHD